MDQDNDGTRGEATQDQFTFSVHRHRRRHDLHHRDHDQRNQHDLRRPRHRDQRHDRRHRRAAQLPFRPPHQRRRADPYREHGHATHKLDLTVAEQVIVDATSKIDVSGKGYLAGRTTGNTTVGGATGDSWRQLRWPGGEFRWRVRTRCMATMRIRTTGAAVVDRVQQSRRRFGANRSGCISVGWERPFGWRWPLVGHQWWLQAAVSVWRRTLAGTGYISANGAHRGRRGTDRGLCPGFQRF